MSLSLPLPNAHFIWYCAWLSIPSAIYAYNHPATTHYTTVPAAVFATSLNYWRNPLRDSWRRTLDIAVVFSGVSYQSYYAFQTTSSSTFTAYSILIAIHCVSYIVQYNIKPERNYTIHVSIGYYMYDLFYLLYALFARKTTQTK